VRDPFCDFRVSLDGIAFVRGRRTGTRVDRYGIRVTREIGCKASSCSWQNRQWVEPCAPRHTEEIDEREVPVEARQLPFRQFETMVRESVRAFSPERWRVCHAKRSPRKPRQDSRTQQGVEIESEVETLRPQPRPELAAFARESPPSPGLQVGGERTAREHTNLVDDGLPCENARGSGFDQPGNVGARPRSAQGRNRRQRPDDIPDRTEADHKNPLSGFGASQQREL
jgi:hypothetical protein